MPENPDVTSPRVLMELFKRYGLQPHRQFGQNFLIDANIVRKITAAAEIQEGDTVIEVGPGAGALTLSLARLGADVVALEIDRGLVRMLEDIFQPWPSVRIIARDALEVNWKDLFGAHFSAGARVKLISNLPYFISGPFMYNLFKERFPFISTVLMFQKEVARRLVADPGDRDYSGLSVLSRYYTEGRVLFDVSNNVFWPRPKVGSSVIKLQPRFRELCNEEEEHFWFIVQGVFQQRRKTIFNNMARLFPHLRADLTSILAEASIDPGFRPEQLTANQFAKMARIIYNYCK